MVTSSSPGNVETIHCGDLVNAAGPNAGHIAKKLGIDLPVKPRKRYIYVIDCPGAPEKEAMPFVIDSSGAYVRSEGGRFICGLSPEDVSLHC